MATPEEDLRSDTQSELEKIDDSLKTIANLLSGDALNAAREQLLTKRAVLVGSGASAQGDHNQVVGESGNLVNGNIGGNFNSGENIELKAGDHAVQIVVKEGGRVVIGEDKVEMTAVDRQSALGRYLEHVIAHNRYLQLQGIGSGGKLVNIELEHIYITLRATRTRQAEEAWLAEESRLAPGEAMKGQALNYERPLSNETITVNVQEALAENRRLVVLGDPGSGKTTLLRYLALTFARDRAEGSTLVKDRLCLEENGHLPKGFTFGLPSEAEWEKAARGGEQLPQQTVIRALQDGLVLPQPPKMASNPDVNREYPWQGKFDPNLANIDQTGIGDTSAVGCFPGGASPYGLLDMSGNVWEWTRSIKESYPYKLDDGREDLQKKSTRVLRGGSFILAARLARCAYRNDYHPANRDWDFGFRVCLSPCR